MEQRYSLTDNSGQKENEGTRKTDVGLPSCQEANTLWEVSTDITNWLKGSHVDSAILSDVFWQKGTFSRTSNIIRVILHN